VAAVKRVRVLLVEDQTLVREGLVSLLSFAKDLEVAGQAADGDERSSRSRGSAPDVVLLENPAAEAQRVRGAQEAGRRGAVPPTLILTTFDDDALLFDAFEGGRAAASSSRTSPSSASRKRSARSPRAARSCDRR
jgi:DNA-binding NarL/FixJ family response regulator